MEFTDIAKYTDKIYAYAVSRTFSEDEAEELSQEILLTAIQAFPKLQDEQRFEPWLWGIAANVSKAFRRNKGRQRAMFLYNAPETMLNMPVLEDSNEELYALLREKIAMLTKIYREVIILHYYDGLSTKQIAKQLNIPLGTVTWRLSRARHKLKKECVYMEETALKPAKMKIDIYGSGNYGNYNGMNIPFPDEFINDSLSQNILWLCYENPKSIEEITKFSGIPACYVEERVENLVKRCAVIEPVKGRYQTDFIIYDDRYGKYCEENAENSLAPILEPLSKALSVFWKEIKNIDFYRAEKSEDELNYLCSIMAFDGLCSKYNCLSYPMIPKNYDGHSWRYLGLMESGAYHRIGIGRQKSMNTSDNKGTYQHDVFALKSFGFRPMMYDKYIDVCENILSGHMEAVNEFHAANAIRDGYILKQDDKLIVTVPAFTREQKAQFYELADKVLSPLFPEYAALVSQFVEGYKKLFPKHLSDDAQRMCYEFFIGFFNVISNYCTKKGILAVPKQEWICDVLTQK